MSNFPRLELYFFASCPFCVMVMNVIHQNKIKVEYKDILADEENRKKLVQDTGRQTVPCLYIDGKPMHESSIIVDWLNKNSDSLEKVNS